jgi:hypothetical protein
MPSNILRRNVVTEFEPPTFQAAKVRNVSKVGSQNIKLQVGFELN